MDSDISLTTHPSLLAQLAAAPIDNSAWDRFVHQYGPAIRGWCHGHGLAGADADEVSQAVLFMLFRYLPSFRYDPSRSFRNWLKVVVRHAVCDFCSDRDRPDAASGSSTVLQMLQNWPLDDLDARLDSEFNRELMALAVERVRDYTWEVFRRTTIEGQSCEAVAADLGIGLTAVYKSRSRFLGMVREEIVALDV